MSDEERSAVFYWAGEEWLPRVVLLQFEFFAVVEGETSTKKVCFRCCMVDDTADFSDTAGYSTFLRSCASREEALGIVQDQRWWCQECFRAPLFTLRDLERPICQVAATQFLLKNVAFGMSPLENVLRQELCDTPSWADDGWNEALQHLMDVIED